MARSGTISQTTFNTRKVIDRAFGRCRITPQRITSEMVDRAMDDLHMLLSALAAEGTPLWCIEKNILALTRGQTNLRTPIGTVDLVNAFFRTVQTVTGTGVNSSLSLTITLDTPASISTIGLKWASASVPVAVQCSNDGLTWTTVAVDLQEVAAGEWTWIDIDAYNDRFYWKVVPLNGASYVLQEDDSYILTENSEYLLTEGADTLSLSDWRFANTPMDILMARLNRDQYQTLPNKTFLGRPLQYWFDRQVDQPVMHLWPAPDDAARYGMVVIYRHRHIMDVGTMAQQIEVPQRWFNAIVARLASMLAVDTPEVDPSLIPATKALADEAMQIIWNDERDRSPIIFAPNIGCYTR